MPLPDRPVANTTMDSEWGQAVHDYTFAPSGCKVHGASNSSVGTTPSKMPLTIADDDPGGFLDAANNQVEIPTDKGGLYVTYIQGNSVNGSAGAGFQSRILIYLNGAEVAQGINDNAGGTNVSIPVTYWGELSAGDILSVYGQRRGGGTNPDLQVVSMIVLRVGAEFGA